MCDREPGSCVPSGRTSNNMRLNRAFTLVEILIVVVILGIIGAIVIPKFSNASATARASMLADDLRTIRTQIVVFKGQHVGVSPGYPECDTSQAPTEAAFIEYMTRASNAAGEIADPGTPGYRYGIYLRSIPVNPVNDKNTVQIIADGAAFPTEGDDSHGWVYQPSTLKFHSDSAGVDEYGKRYFDY